MARVRLQRFWQQKHPTPGQRGWDFHWYPELPAGVRERISALQARYRAPAGASLALIAPDLAVYARTFSGFVPAEQRHYIGLAGVVATAEGRVDPPSILAAMRLPPAEPCTDQGVDAGAEEIRVESAASLPSVPRDLAAELVSPAARGSLLQAVAEGGTCGLSLADDERLLRLIGPIVGWLPPVTAERLIALVPADRAPPSLPPEVKNLYHYLGAVLFPEDGSDTRVVWLHVLGLAAARGATLRELFAELTKVANAWDTAPALREYLLASGALRPEEVARCDRVAPAPLFDEAVPDAGWLWNRVLHYWGRGLLGDDELVERLAGVLACRVVVDHLFRLDHPEAIEMPWRHVRRLLFEALLTHETRARLLDRLAARLPDLAPLGGLA